MTIRVIFLGTSGSVPTPKRSLPAVLVQFPRDQLLFDCGENVQRQMVMGKISFHRKMKIFITHLHGDHVLGLPGLLQTMALMDRKEPVRVYAPHGLKDFLICAKETLNFSLTFPLEINEISEDPFVCDESAYQVIATKSNHAVESYSFALIEKPRPGKFYPEKALALGVPAGELWSKLQRGLEVTAIDGKIVKPGDVMGSMRSGRKIVYTGDTKPYDYFGKFAKEADLVIHDCTFDDSIEDKAAIDGHSTPSQAALQAIMASAKKLVLFHISARYPDASLLLDQAKRIFSNTILAEDLMELSLPLNE